MELDFICDYRIKYIILYNLFSEYIYYVSLNIFEKNKNLFYSNNLWMKDNVRDFGNELLYSELTWKIIKAFYTVYNTLGYGFWKNFMKMH